MSQINEVVMYIVEKEGVYLHGVFWIGSDIDKAKRKADEFAASDSDDYHCWIVRKFEEVDPSCARKDVSHLEVYATRKGNT